MAALREVTAQEVMDAIRQCKPTDVLVRTRVGNLVIIRSKKQVGWIDLGDPEKSHYDAPEDLRLQPVPPIRPAVHCVVCGALEYFDDHGIPFPMEHDYNKHPGPPLIPGRTID